MGSLWSSLSAAGNGARSSTDDARAAAGAVPDLGGFIWMPTGPLPAVTPASTASFRTIVFDKSAWDQSAQSFAATEVCGKSAPLRALHEAMAATPAWPDARPLPSRCSPTHRDKPMVVLCDGAATATSLYVDSRGLFAAAYAAWAQELPLIVRPDDFWTLLLQQLSGHINKHEADFRDRFVNFEGKEKAELEYDSFPSWPRVIDDLCGVITKRVKPDTLQHLQPLFSTTTEVDRVVQRVLLLGVVRSYFEYGCSCTCGLPGVTLRGTQEDWDLLVTAWTRLPHILRLDELCATAQEGGSSKDPRAHIALRNWFGRASTVLRQLQATRTGAADISWWARMVHAEQKSVMEGSSTMKQNFFSGWLAELVLYTKDGRIASLPMRWKYFPSSMAGVPVSAFGKDVLVIAGTPGFTLIMPPTASAGGATVAEADAGAAGAEQAGFVACDYTTAGASEPASIEGAIWGISAVAGWTVIDAEGVVCKD